MNSRNSQKKNLYNILINNRETPCTTNNNNKKRLRSLDYSTTSTSNKINNIPATLSNNNNNRYYQIKQFEKYSNYYFINKNKDEKTELTLLKNGIDSLLNNSNSKISPLKIKKFERNLISKRLKIKNSLIEKNYSDFSDIWIKLKNSKSMMESYKYKRANILEKINRCDFKEKQRELNKIINDSNLKINHINKLQKLYKKEKSSLINMENKLKKSCSNLDNVYNKNNEVVSNIIFMTAIEESDGNNKLIIKKRKLKEEITKMENKIIKLKSEKDEILKWIYLFIQLKEKKIILPKYYKDILDKNIPYNLLIKLNSDFSLSKKEYERIKLYKNNLMFNDADEFFDRMEYLNKNIIVLLNDKKYIASNKNKIIKENIKIKLDESFNKIKSNFNDDSTLKKELNELKEINYKLKCTRTDKNNYNIKNIKKYNKKVYFHLLKLFEEFKALKFNIINYNINTYDKEEKIIMNILECFELNLNYLLNEKKEYNSKEELKEKYKEAESKVKKESIYLKFLKQYKLLEQLKEEKNIRIQKGMQIPNYLPFKKVDFQYYLRSKQKVKKIIKKEEGKDEIYKNYILFS